jgi:SAM-dependent methyltransferase
MLDLVCEYGGITSVYGKRLLVIGCGSNYLLTVANAMGFQGTGVDLSGDSIPEMGAWPASGSGRQMALDFPPESFDICVLLEAIEYIRPPLSLMESVWRLLKPDGALLVTAPLVDSLSERCPRDPVEQCHHRRLYFFEPSNLQMLLYRSGFAWIRMRESVKALDLDSDASPHVSYPAGGGLAGAFMRVARLLPKFMRRRSIHVSSGPMIALAKKTATPIELDKLSVVLPVYNEDRTFPVIMEQLLSKTIPGMAMEIVIVESNSTDATRQLALQFKDLPQVKLILEDRPRGKGHAVRAGISQATGDIILIQDGDLEYDLSDYEALLMPITRLKRSFVLGSRHTTSVWKMRKFKEQPIWAAILNMGHHALTSIFNILYGQSLKDPFTMFKVFRADCIRGMTFECDRFDFDIELVIKLIQRGFQPIEIPVNYRSRSFEEGKKVSFLKDPIRILAVMLKRKFMPGMGAS